MEKIRSFLKRRKRGRAGGISGSGFFNNRSGWCYSSRDFTGAEKHSRRNNKQSERYHRERLLRDESGIVVIELLLVSLILVFLTYSGIEYWSIMARHQQASHLVNEYLSKMSLEGRLSAADESELISDFDNIGLTVTNIQAVKESEGEARVLRDPQNPSNSMLKLKVTADFKNEPLWTGLLIGGSSGSGSQIVVGGEVLSERYLP